MTTHTHTARGMEFGDSIILPGSPFPSEEKNIKEKNRKDTMNEMAYSSQRWVFRGSEPKSWAHLSSGFQCQALLSS